MRVLILDSDLFATVGGGQTFYRNVIVKNPDIDFYYLRNNEPAGATKPFNAHPIDHREPYSPTALLHYCDINVPYWTQAYYLKAHNIASTVAGQSFDIVDYPDYSLVGLFLRDAFKAHAVNVGRIAISMHGLISTTNAMNWDGNGDYCRVARCVEELQYEVADTRYFISERYQQEWNTLRDVPSYYIDPLHLFAAPNSLPYVRCSSEAPSLNFIGRTEKRKGPHVFLQLLWWLRPNSYSAANIIGPFCAGATGETSTQTITKMSHNRGLNIQFLGSMSAPELQRVFASRSVTCVPSLYDTFNLVALESLFSGCPTLIGSGAGIVDYLRDRFPAIPFEIVDMNAFFESTPAIEAMLDRYDEYRHELSVALTKSDYTPHGPKIHAIYDSSSTRDEATCSQISEWYFRLEREASKINF